MNWTRTACIALAVTAVASTAAPVMAGTPSIARVWNDQMLEAIRNDFARPTVHARNLFHVSGAIYDAWAAYDDIADQYFHVEKATGVVDLEGDREKTISYAAYGVLSARFATSPGADETLPALDTQMGSLGYSLEATKGDAAAELGERIAATVLAFGAADNSGEACDFCNSSYEPINPPLVPALSGNPDILDPNRWQPLALEFFVDQSGNVIVGGFPDALSPEWGIVTPFSLTADDLTIYNRDGFDYWVYHDPGPPPYLGGVGDDYYKWGNEMVIAWSSHLDPTDGVMIDISPASFGNSPLPGVDDYEAYYDFENGGDWGTGYTLNPVTGLPYTPQIVPRGDYARILAEFWADGPDSETPPGHWFTVANYVTDHPSFVKQWGGEGPILDDLEWDVRMHLALGGCMHDVAITSWGVKGWYDYVRPVSAIRHMCDLGQSSHLGVASYNPDGISLIPGLIEEVTPFSAMPGQRHANLAGSVGEIAVFAWRGPDYIANPDTDDAGVGWILAGDWWPYQRPSFVTPPFPGYVSGHSTYSRAAARIMEFMTGSPYFPDGLGEFEAPQNEFLVFEEGPSVNVTLQWASYIDASDQTSLSRIWGGIHPPADDIPGRHMGEAIAPDAFELANKYFNGQITCPWDLDANGGIGFADLNYVLSNWGPCGDPCPYDFNGDGSVGFSDLNEVLGNWGPCD